ncbi:hypothetical protein [Ochrobactrum sp. MYb379]|uniref:hypothetical protein n=1 Tax=Ochrobactrum sp. MYb379 TaxID=2745275 RepID=UPI0030B7E709
MGKIKLWVRYLSPVWVGLSIAFCGVLVLEAISMFRSDGFCSPDDMNGTSCFRQWASALGGWAAAIIAGLTAAIIIRQMHHTEKHHRENISRIEAPERSTAKQAISVLKKLFELASQANTREKHSYWDIYEADGEFYMQIYKQMRNLLDDPVFMRMHSMDVSLVAFHQTAVSNELDDAIQKCDEGIRISRKKLVIIQTNRRILINQQPETLLSTVDALRKAANDAIKYRFPDIEV